MTIQSRKRHKDYTPEDWAQYATQIKLQRKAYKLVAKAIELGVLPSPLSLQCVVCHKSAHFYHHPNGYTGKSALDVVPTCQDCHAKLHSDYPPHYNK